MKLIQVFTLLAKVFDVLTSVESLALILSYLSVIFPKIIHIFDI